MFAFVFSFLSWLPPMLHGFCYALVGVFSLYAILRLLKLLWDILPIA